jgi:protein LTV1
LEEQHKYGVYYDDDYDYMQHLRTADEIRQVGTGEGFRIVNNIGGSSKPSVQLPASVFASVEETDVGMLSRGTVTGQQLRNTMEIVVCFILVCIGRIIVI